jgi:hypothetical protein
MHNRTFHQVSIGGMTFEGIVSRDGPYLSCRMKGGVALGPSGLRYFQPDTWSAYCARPLSWWVVKYHSEARILLPGFDRASVDRLAREFALPVVTEAGRTLTDRERREVFLASPAGVALCQWVIGHPRLAKAHAACDPYLPGWYDRAIAEAKLLAV